MRRRRQSRHPNADFNKDDCYPRRQEPQNDVRLESLKTGTDSGLRSWFDRRTQLLKGIEVDQLGATFVSVVIGPTRPIAIRSPLSLMSPLSTSERLR